MKPLAALVAMFFALPLAAQEMENAPGGTLRFLDKLTGRVVDLPLGRGQAVQEGRLTVLLDECRFPRDNPAADAQAHITVRDRLNGDQPVFSGWMLGSSPALSAMDHPRYDIWVLSCDSGFVAPEMTDPINEQDAEGEEINEG